MRRLTCSGRAVFWQLVLADSCKAAGSSFHKLGPDAECNLHEGGQPPLHTEPRECSQTAASELLVS